MTAPCEMYTCIRVTVAKIQRLIMQKIKIFSPNSNKAADLLMTQWLPRSIRNHVHAYNFWNQTGCSSSTKYYTVLLLA
jgi:hypothetical protein